MIKELKIRVLPKQASSEYNIIQAVSQEYAIDLSSIKAIRVLKRSIDARQRQVMINMQLKVYINEIPTDDEYIHTYYGDVSDKSPVIIVGAGPAGLFAALRLIELGRRPIIIERGKNVHERRKDIARISREQIVNSESNYSFGEGGAGAFSDGKLYTRSKKRGSVDRILNIFCQHGADTSILADAHPHIGTDKLPVVIENIRKQIEKSGGEIHFETRMDKLLIKNDEIIGRNPKRKRVSRTRYSGNRTFCQRCILSFIRIRDRTGKQRLRRRCASGTSAASDRSIAVPQS